MNIYFIYSHLDDETILSYGTLKKLSCDNSLFVIILCKGRDNTQHQIKRKEVFIKNIKNIGAKYKVFNSYDLNLTHRKIKYSLDYLTKYMPQPNIIFTHSICDLHFEHRMVAEEVMIKFRPTSNVIKFITSVSPTYTWTNQQFGIFNPNMFVDISNYADEKRKALKLYSMEFKENDNDNRSVESIMTQNRQYGFQMNTQYCEAYQVLWSKE